jgi:hypothetical protein
VANAKADKKLKEALDANRWEDVLSALKSGANPNTKAPESGYALPHACWYRQLDVVRELLARGADPNINKGEPLERTAYKSSNGDARQILQLLLDHRVKLDFQYPRRHNATALSIAIETGHLQVAEMLVKAKADLTIKNDDGSTPLQLAKEWGYRKLVEQMTSKSTKGKRAAIDPFVAATYVGRIAKGRAPHTSGVPDWKKVFKGKHYPGCGNPPVHLLTIDLSLIPEFPAPIRRLGKMPIVSHACECDERDYYEFAIGRDRRLSDTDSWKDRNNCDRADYRGSKKATPIQLTRQADMKLGDLGIYVGGQPRWAQSPIWPSCPRCEEASFFVATLHQYDLPPSARGAGNTLNVFACGACRTQCMIRQST